MKQDPVVLTGIKHGSSVGVCISERNSMEDYNELIQQRFQKLAEISAMGIKRMRQIRSFTFGGGAGRYL